jgi:hypothetical protein
MGGERFPVEAWPSSADCPLPPGTPNNAAELQLLGVDSVFYGFGTWQSQCTPSYAEVLTNISASDGWWHVFVDGESESERESNAALPRAIRAAVVDAVLIGDEVDGTIDAQHLRKVLNLSLANIEATADLVTYQGGATNSNVGAFAGVADIQGMDACAFFLRSQEFSHPHSICSCSHVGCLFSQVRRSVRADPAASHRQSAAHIPILISTERTGQQQPRPHVGIQPAVLGRQVDTEVALIVGLPTKPQRARSTNRAGGALWF